MLTERQLKIFQLIIDEFVKSARPIGSRVISEKENISVSPATIRNVMADLENMGYLKKTHSSSGRIPSQKGYRYYVDHLITPTTEDVSDINVIRHLIEDGFYEFEKVVQLSANVLSDLTNYTTIILGPEVFETKLKQIQIVKLSSRTAIAILVTNTGLVEHRTFFTPEEINGVDIEKLVNILNERLTGIPMFHLSQKLDEEVRSLIKNNINIVDTVLDHLKEVLQHEKEHTAKLYVGGKANLLRQPEFKDIEKVHSFYVMMEEEDKIANILKRTDDTLQVTIGRENEYEAIHDFTLVTAPYRLGNDYMGTIALIGPVRMQYRRAITLLKALSNEMSETFYHWYKDNPFK